MARNHWRRLKYAHPLWKSEIVGTPQGMKPLVSRRMTKAAGKRWRVMRNAARVDVQEPAAQLLELLMQRESMSDRRVALKLGIPKHFLKRMRQEEELWKAMKVLRGAMWLLGYELEMRAVKYAQCDADIALTHEQVRRGDLYHMVGAVRPAWNRGDMWAELEKVKREIDT